ncbi:MAG: TerB N-terminal domain-containing protein [Clostridia bacterium]|nr:TerB N-terminal domain-containing protein [Clostridia bacterium]
MKDSFDDLDRDFFDLASHSAGKAYAAPKKRDTGTSEISTEQAEHKSSGQPAFRIPPAGRDKAASRQIRTAHYSGASFDKRPPRRTGEKNDDSTVLHEYSPNGYFVKHVSVMSWPQGYSFYEKFVRDAAVSNSRRGSKAPHVPFFSYIPQFTQLNAPQWAYYLYMKECAREGVCLTDADFSYVLLYIYEIINLEGVISPEAGASLLGTAWMLYRRVHPMLDKYMSEWMADYCLLYGLPLPRMLYPILAEIASRSTVKEFYADALLKHTPGEAGRLFRLSLSDHDPSRSRYASRLDNFASLTEEVFDSAAAEQLRDKSGIFDKKLCRSMTVSRDAFCGSLCAASVKKKIVLTLETPFRAPEVRRVVTEMMKGAENIVRARMGVKARLAAPVLEGKSAAVSARTEEERAYLSFYESPTEELSADAAAKIELESWQNTELLAGDELAPETESETCDEPEVEGAMTGGDNIADEPAVEVQDDTAAQDKGLRDALGDELYQLLRRAADGESFKDACRERGAFADDAASRINEIAMDIIGDVVLEASGTDYVFIEDYRDDI